MLNATIDRFAFEAISLHDDQVAFHAKISIAKKVLKATPRLLQSGVPLCRESSSIA